MLSESPPEGAAHAQGAAHWGPQCGRGDVTRPPAALCGVHNQSRLGQRDGAWERPSPPGQMRGRNPHGVWDPRDLGQIEGDNLAVTGNPDFGMSKISTCRFRPNCVHPKLRDPVDPVIRIHRMA